MTPSTKAEKIQTLQNIRALAADELFKLGVLALDGQTEESMLRSEMNEMSLARQQIAQALGMVDAPMRDLPAVALRVRTERDELRAAAK